MSRSSLSEEDVKNRYITPAINKAGWETTDYLTPFVKLSQKNKKAICDRLLNNHKQK